MLAKTPLFTLFAVLILAIAIGANITVFSFVTAIFSRPLAIPEPDRFVRLYTPDAVGNETLVSDYSQYRDQAQSLASIGGYNTHAKSGKPVYLQVVDQVKAAAASGALQPGEALPFIRPLAEELRVNRNTIAKAYTELESIGVIETMPGKGCFVKENGSLLRKDVRRKMLIEEIDQTIVQAHHLSISAEEFLNLVHQRMEVLQNKRRANGDAGEDR